MHHITQYGYDAVGNRTVITDANTLAGTGQAVRIVIWRWKILLFAKNALDLHLGQWRNSMRLLWIAGLVAIGAAEWWEADRAGR